MSSELLQFDRYPSFSKIFLLGCKSDLSIDVNLQLTSLEGVIPVCFFNTEIPDITLDEVSHVIYFLGPFRHQSFGVDKILESLRILLNKCFKSNTRLIIVLSSLHITLKRQIIKSVIQFVGKNSLSYDLVEYDSLLPLEYNSEKVIQTIVFGFKYQNRILGQFLQPPSSGSVSDIKNKNILKLFKFAIAGLVSVGLVYCLGFISLVLFKNNWECVIKNFRKYDFSSAFVCLNKSEFYYKYYMFNRLYLPGLASMLDTDVPEPVSQAIIYSQTREVLKNLSNYSSPDSFLKPDLLIKSEISIEKLRKSLVSDNPTYLKSAVWSSDLLFQTSRYLKVLDKLSSVTDYLSYLSGSRGETTFLIIFQNSNFSFPSGGKIDSFWLLTLNRGQMVGSKFYNLTQLLSSFVGKIPSPSDYKLVTGNMFLPVGLSNWESEFNTFAGNFSSYFSKALDQKVDFVIGINDSVYPDLLSITGSVKLPKSEILVSAQNYQDLKNSILNQTPNQSTFIGLLSRGIIQNLLSASLSKRTQFYFWVLNLFENRQLFISSVSSDLPKFSHIGWSGRIQMPDCPRSGACLNTFIYPVNTFIGNSTQSGKMNMQGQLNIYINPKEVDTSIKFLIKNESADYLRVYLPKSVIIKSVFLNGYKIQNGLFPSIQNVDVYSWGFLLPAGSATGNILEMNIFQPLDTGPENLHLQIEMPAQPGVEDFPLEVNLGYPRDWLITTNQNPQVAAPGSLRYNTRSCEFQKIIADFKTP